MVSVHLRPCIQILCVFTFRPQDKKFISDFFILFHSFKFFCFCLVRVLLPRWVPIQTLDLSQYISIAWPIAVLPILQSLLFIFSFSFSLILFQIAHCVCCLRWVTYSNIQKMLHSHMAFLCWISYYFPF